MMELLGPFEKLFGKLIISGSDKSLIFLLNRIAVGLYGIRHLLRELQILYAKMPSCADYIKIDGEQSYFSNFNSFKFFFAQRHSFVEMS